MVMDNGLVDANIKLEKPLILLIPIRLGIDKIDQKYFSHIYMLFTCKYFNGLLGGKHRSAYYIIGIDSDLVVYYMDPHYLQDVDSITFECPNIHKCKLSDIDPNITISFCVTKLEELKEIYKLLNDLEGFPIKVDTIPEYLSEQNVFEDDNKDWLLID